jgi:2-polyprenyl-3-methyl-5-hydroxy-6-metoxy-1,4-benzoquinol methylase
MVLINRNSCPFCDSNNIHKVLQCTDASHSKEWFDILECASCTGRFTQQVPDEKHIGSYYAFADYVSHNNEAKGLINTLYLQARKYTLYTKWKLVKKYTTPPNIQLADIGSGTGAFVHYCTQQQITVQGFEPDDSARAVAKNTFNIQLQPAHEWFNQQPAYHAITLWHVLEHLHELERYLKSFYEKLIVGGYVFIAVPNYTSADAKYYKQRWAAYDVPRHLYHFSPTCMQQLASKYGFTIETIKPMWLDGYYVSMLTEKQQQKGLAFVKGLWRGLLTHIKLLSNKTEASSLIYVLKKT